MAWKHGKDRPVDMAILPPAERYEPPPESECDFHDDEIDLFSEGRESHVLYSGISVRRGKVVWFCLEQKLRRDGVEHKVERIDTDHGHIHRHCFREDGRNSAPEELSPLARDRGHDEVDRAYDEHREASLNRWDENVRRWRRS